VEKKLFLLADRIKKLREKAGFTQVELSNRLGLTRSSVNAWEMGLSVPSTPYIVELAGLFQVSADYLLGIDKTATLPIDGLSERQRLALISIIDCFKSEPPSET